MPVPPGSTRIRDELTAFFSGASLNEAARLLSKLSNKRDQDHLLMSRRVHPSTIPKLLEILRVNSGRHTAKPVPDRLTDEALKSEFLSIEDPTGDASKKSTSFEDVFNENRSAELFAEAGKRGQAFSTPAPETERLMDLDLKLHQATQKFDYAGVDLQYLTSTFPKPPVNNLGGSSRGYYRILEKLSDNQLYEVSEDSVKRYLPSVISYKGPETIGTPYVDKKEKVIVIRYPTEIALKTKETKTHVYEIWWFAENKAEFNYLHGHAETAASFNPTAEVRFYLGGELEGHLRVKLGILMRPLVGDEILFDQMKREAIGAAVSGASNRLAQKGAQKILNKPRGGGDAGDAGTSGKKKVDLSQPGAFKQLAGASADEVAAALRDPALFGLYKKSLKKGPEREQAATDIQDLGKIIAQHTPKGPGGVFKMNQAVSAAVWALPEHLRGILVENALGHTQYKGWFQAGQLNQGFFPDIDFALTTPGSGPQRRASVKSVNTFAKGYEEQLTQKLPEHVETLVSGTQNDIKAGRRPAVTIVDIRLPPGSSVPGSELAQTLKDLIPSYLRQYIRIEVNEF